MWRCVPPRSQVLAEHYKTELAAVDCQTLRVDTFGQGLGFSQRAMLLYDGIHCVCAFAERACGPALRAFAKRRQAASDCAAHP